MKAYLALLQDVVDNGFDKGDRTGVGTRSVFGRQIRFNLKDGFPLVTTKKVHLRSIIYELLWFLSGSTDNTWLIVSAWNPAELPDESIGPQDNVRQGRMALAPCHCLFQFYVADGKLSCQLYQRSADLFLGVPFNIASYALLTHMIAQQCDLDVGEFVHTFGDCHLYQNHLTDDIVFEQLKREPKALPNLIIKRKPASIFEYELEDFEFQGYDPYPGIKAPIAI